MGLPHANLPGPNNRGNYTVTLSPQECMMLVMQSGNAEYIYVLMQLFARQENVNHRLRNLYMMLTRGHEIGILPTEPDEILVGTRKVGYEYFDDMEVKL